MLIVRATDEHISVGRSLPIWALVCITKFFDSTKHSHCCRYRIVFWQAENIAGQSDESSIKFSSCIRWEFLSVVKLVWELWVFICHCIFAQNFVLTSVYKGLLTSICLLRIYQEWTREMFEKRVKPFQPQRIFEGPLNALSPNSFHGNYVTTISITHLPNSLYMQSSIVPTIITIIHAKF